MRKLCVVSGTRADYGFLRPVMLEILRDPGLELQLIVTGMHLAPEFGLTYRQLERDGLAISAKVETQLSSDTGVGTAKSLGLGVIGMADALERLRPDCIIVLGDRYEILAAAQAALFSRIPIAHMAGGDTTEGAFDEAIRHALTKMSQLHFVTHEAARQRVIQLGEDPRQVYNFGSSGLDTLRQQEPLAKADLEAALGLKLWPKTLLITYHPVTLEAENSKGYENLLVALAQLGPDVGFVFTGSNADPEGRRLYALTEAFVARHRERARLYSSLGDTYLQLMRHASAVVGNSSSGLYEAPSFGLPTVNVGDRQRGRPKAESVFDAPPETDAIVRALNAALTRGVQPTSNPYGDGHTAPRIVKVLKEASLSGPLKKHFHDLPVREGVAL